MSKQIPPIITLPHASLRKSSKTVATITPEVLRLVEDMKAATLKWEAGREHEVGVALAAVQINRHQRVVIVRQSFEDKKDTSFTAYINPKITASSGKPVLDYEGCLSVQDIYAVVPRFPEIEISAMNLDGTGFTEKISDFRARVMQHEIDHLDGKLFIDHIKQYDVFFKLNSEGDLEKLDHDKVITSHILW